MSYILIQRLIAVRDEYNVARASVAYLKRLWPQLLTEADFRDLDLLQIKQAFANLEVTYTVRLFSTFEAVLRDSLPRRSVNSPDRRSAYDLINRSASKWRIAGSIKDDAHRVREIRNLFVHRNELVYPVVLFSEALAILSRFLAWLPDSL